MEKEDSLNIIFSMINKKYGKNTSSNLPMDMIGVSLTGFLLYYGKWVLPILRDLVFESDFFYKISSFKRDYRRPSVPGDENFFGR